MPSPMDTTTRCGLFLLKYKSFDCNTRYKQGAVCVQHTGSTGEHVAIHHQRRILSMGEAEKRDPGGATV